MRRGSRIRGGATPALPERRLHGVINLWAATFAVWLIANASLEPSSLAAGAVICAVLAFLFAPAGGAWAGIRWTPRALWHFVMYLIVFLVEIVRANINMLRYVYAPHIEIRPGIVAVKTRLKSRLGRLVLANSIALTPGSLVVELEGDTLFIHWLDVRSLDPDEATRVFVRPFEKHLEVIFG